VHCGNQNKMDDTKTYDIRKHIPWRYICVLGVSILSSFSTILRLDFGTLLTVLSIFVLYFLNLCSAIEIKFMSKAGICIFNVASTNKTNKRISLNTKRQRHTTVEIQVLAKYVGVNCLKECKPSHLDNWISNGNTYINKR
jgi:hypothetical protein